MASGNTGAIRQIEPAVSMERKKAEVRPRRQVALQGVGYDYLLLLSVVLMFAIGLLMIYSSSQYMAMIETGQATYYFRKQLIIGGAGLIGAVVLSKISYRVWKAGLLPFIEYAAAFILPMLTLIMGVASHGKTRWITIFGYSFQPAELTKLALIVSLASVLDIAKSRIKNNKFFLLLFAACLLPAGLIFSQNLSSGFIVMFIVAVMLFVAGNKGEWFLSAAVAGLTAFLLAKPLVRLVVEKSGYTGTPGKYYLRRILAWALPEVYTSDAYQTTQGLYAIGSGGLFGRGLGESIQKFGKIPEVQNDMIFTVICEEFGFVGAICIIALYAVILCRIYQIGRRASDRMGNMICVGVMAHLGIQVVLNLAVVTGVFPNTGVTLPFISYGGSAILFTMAEIGLVLSVSCHSAVKPPHA